jgi:DNA-binding response OmpR family regulator
MLECRRVLVVAPNPAVGGCIVGWLSAERYDVHLCTSFKDAKPQLDARPPDLLITELKLGACNGLHLAIRAKCLHPRTMTIVVGEQDALFEGEARRHDAAYITRPLKRDLLTELARTMLRDNTQVVDGSAVP